MDHEERRCVSSKMEKQGTCITNSCLVALPMPVKRLITFYLWLHLGCSELVLHVPLFPIMTTAPCVTSLLPFSTSLACLYLYIITHYKKLRSTRFQHQSKVTHQTLIKL
ncbi:hypothetical protein ERO13_A09G168500v2 [Gossypium hirsutum]|uniref:Uncharacterized protein n=4 Tax=Gossypium TaxID=3633 RepID=A0A5J5UGS8_GOSBA|nr:hypothetical protein ES319_A09G177800v1 [Gossypium barbadense]KAG4184356.1 hypothetical protein ERO13_A09G168500v2 [Gossypium hirsutum]TYH03183.1 hypothetical protein ES288_A09G200900v1 [Gossypium darwinii]TYI11230.1 hypothetical protein ES332_A09G197000v1 [Gossypium tomentosum]TYJ19265.1 hypothetical protein E1A91_A09G180900v1 [Gossypium mustelinum]